MEDVICSCTRDGFEVDNAVLADCNNQAGVVVQSSMICSSKLRRKPIELLQAVENLAARGESAIAARTGIKGKQRNLDFQF